jgi:hypothetical protein
MTITQLEPGDAYMIVVDIGSPPPLIERDKDWRVNPPLPLVMTRAALDGPYKSGFPSGASLNAVIENRALMIRVRFGSQPSEDQLVEVNEMLASLGVAPAMKAQDT